jgi:hypothetical protein
MEMKVDDGVIFSQGIDNRTLELNTMGIIHGCVLFPIGG